MQSLGNRQAELERRLSETRRQVDVFSQRIVKAMDEGMVPVYEEQIMKYRREGELIQEKLKTLGVASVSFETALEIVFGFLENPLVIWEKEDMNAKRLVLKLVFAEKLAFHPDLGFETTQKSPFVGLFEQFSAKKTQDVEVRGIEPRSKEKRASVSTMRRSSREFRRRA